MKYLLLAAMLLLARCSSKDAHAQRDRQNYQRYYPLIVNAEKDAAPPARKVLRTARSMVVNGEIVRGERCSLQKPKPYLCYSPCT